MDPRASVIILNYNGERFLEACLKSVLEQELDGGFEVIVFDNASTDGSVGLVRDRFPDVRLLTSDRNLGFAAGNNRAMAAARAPYLVLLNNDTRVRRGWLNALVAAVESDERAGAITAKLVFADRPGVIQNAGLLLLSDGSGADRGAGEPDDGRYDRREEVFGICGASALLRRDAIVDAGAFDERFFVYYEDTDLSWRLRLRGWKVLYEPAAVVEHVHAGTSVEWSPFFTFNADRNRLLMLLKDAPPRLLAHALSRLAKRAATGGGAPQARAARTAAMKARVIASVLAAAPGVLVDRRRIRRSRQVADADIERWLFPREEWERRRSA